MAAIILRTLGDYAASYTPHADCPACRHHSRLNPLQAAHVVGWDADLRAVKAKLRCSRCGARHAEVRISHNGQPG